MEYDFQIRLIDRSCGDIVLQAFCNSHLRAELMGAALAEKAGRGHTVDVLERRGDDHWHPLTTHTMGDLYTA